MPLPNIPLATGRIELGGEWVEYRALSAAEAIALGNLNGRSGDAGTVILSHALGISEEEAQAWLDATPIEPATELLTAIIELSGLEDQVKLSEGKA